MLRYFAILLSALLLASCSPSAPKKAAEIDKLENTLRESSKNNIVDTAKVKQLMGEYVSYANAFPTDSMTPVYMMKAGKFYDFASKVDSAIYCYHFVYAHFPAYPKANLALFSEAFLYSNETHDLVKSKALYEEYVSKYPKTKLAESAAMELRTLGKTPDQIMAEMDSMKKAKSDSAAIAKK